MKKFLLTLIVTMLTCIGAWAQGSPQTIEKELFVGDIIYWSPGDDVVWSTTKADVGISDFAVKSGDEEYVTAVLENGSYKLTGLKKTTTPATITFTATNYEWGRGSILETVECTAKIEVKGYDCEITISPDPVNNMNKGDNASYTYSALWTKGGNPIADTYLISTSASSSEGDIVKCDNTNNSGILGMDLVAQGGGTATITVRSTYKGQVEEKSFDIEVFDPSMATSLSLGEPVPSSTFYQGKSITVPVTFAPESAVLSATVSPDGQGVTASVVGNTLTISATESATVGNYTVTVNPVSGSEASAQSVDVIVKDKTHASSIDAPETVSVAYGYTKEIPVTFEPVATAVVTVSYPTIDGVTISPTTLNKDNKTITVNATGATAAGDYTITLTSGAETADEVSKTIALSIVAPIGVDEVKFTNTEIADGKLKLAKGSTITLNAVTDPANAANTNVTLALTSNGDNAIAFDPATGLVNANNRGVAVVTATSEMNSEKTATVEIEVTDVIPVTLPEPSSKFRVGETHPSAFVIGGGLSADDYDITYKSSDASVITVDGVATSSTKDNGGLLQALKPGKSTLTVVVTPKNNAITQHYTEYTNSIEITVTEAEYGLAIAADPTKLSSGTVNVTPAVTLNDVEITEGNYQIVYSLSNATSGITINPTTGQVTVPAETPSQLFSIVANLTPTGDDAANYKGATATVGVFVGDANAKVTISVDDDGVYTVNVPYPGAFAYGNIASADRSNPTSYVSGDNAAELIAGLKDATSVKVTGYVSNDDIAEVVYLVGDGNNGTRDSEKVCKSLDMGGAKMTEEIEISVTDTFDGQDIELSWDKDHWGHGLFDLESLTLPQPAPGYTIVPQGMHALWASGQTLTSLTIPEGWTAVSQYAFNTKKEGNGLKNLTTLNLANSIETIGYAAFRNMNKVESLVMPESLVNIDGHAFEGCLSLTSLKFNDDLKYIGPYAFSSFMVQVLDMPYNIERIGAYAFSPSPGLQDVYFYGPAPKYVDTDAFAGVSQMANNTVADNAVKGKDPVITRYAYEKGGVMACLLHYPIDRKDEYIDGTREYEMLPPDEEYTKGGSTYWPGYWSSDFLTNTVYNKVTNSEAKGAMQEAVTLDHGVKDQFYGRDMIWPSQSQMMAGFAIAQAGYQWTGGVLRPADQYDPAATYENGGVDKRGLYQFIVAMSNSTFEHTYQQDLWYTIALPFDMTPAEVKQVFGENTQVCRFSNVIRQIDDEGNKVIKLEFRESVMDESDNRPQSDYVYMEAKRDAEGNVIYVDGVMQKEPVIDDKHGIRHHCPYMIKPSGDVEEIPNTTEIIINPDNGKKSITFYGFQRVSGYLHNDDKTAGGYTYSFAPILQQTSIYKNSYIFVNKINGSAVPHQYVFFKGIEENGEYRDGGTAIQNTAYVQITHGAQELADFFTAASPAPSSNYAPINASVFGTDGEVNGIEKVEIVCGNDDAADNKVYTINGVLVNGNHLPAGLYIKNGKKFIVK